MWGEMKKPLIILLILSIAAVSWAYEVELSNPNRDDFKVVDTLPDKWMIDSIFQGGTYMQVTAIVFNGVTITWENGYLDVIYDEGITKTEAARQFFDYLKQYIEGEYILIPRVEYEREKMKK